MKKILPLLFVCSLSSTFVDAQTPVISEVTPIRTYPGSKVVITGSGFSATPANLEVWFDNVKGTIISSSEFSIEVTVPFPAKAGNVVVVNKASKLSGKSSAEFAPYFSGESMTAASAPGKFGANQVASPASPNESFDICTCDFDGDGKADVVGSRTSATGGPATEMTVLRNTSTLGTVSFFASTTPVASGAHTFNTACGDLNGDGKPDLIATRAVINRNQLFVKENTSTVGNISFGAATTLLMDVNHVAFRPIIRDLNGDGKPEIIVSNAFDSPGNAVYVFINQSTTTISINPNPLKLTIPDASSSYGIEVQDLDGDDKAEIIVNQFNKPDFFVLKNTSGAQVSLATAQKFTLGGTLATLNHLTTADFNNDGKLDLAFTNSTVNNKVHVLLNNSTTSAFSFTEVGPFNTGDGAFGIDAADVDGDKDIDIAVGNIDFTASTPNTEVTLLINNGVFNALSFEAVNINTGKKSRNIKLADLDGDAKPEIIYTTVSGNSIDVLRNKNCFVPLITNPTPLSVCSGQTIILESITNPGATFQWSQAPSTALGTSNTQSITTPGDYTVQATSEGGACVTTANISVGVDTQSVTQNPVITSGSGGVMTVCVGGSLQLGTSSVEPTYSWTGPNGFTSSSKDPLVTSAAGEPHAGIYELELRNGVCRSNKATIRVDLVSLLGFVVTSVPPSGTVCQGSNLTLSTANVGGYSYQWIKDGSGDIAAQTTSSLTVTQDGSYRVRVTRTVEGCSTETANFAAVIATPPVASFTASRTAGCTGESITFNSTSQLDSRVPATYSWNFGDATTPATTASPAHTYNTAQTFTVTLTVGYANVAGCTSNTSSSITISSPVNPVITASATGICPGETIDVSIPATYTSIVWSNGATTAATSVTAAGTVTVNARDANSCATNASVDITARPVPTITITTDPNPPTVAPGQAVAIVAVGADTYLWSPTDNLSDPAIANPMASPLITTTYSVAGTVTDGCTGTAEVTIEVLGELQVTNAFSPNGDGINDLWVIPGIVVYSECTVSIFDSLGRRILEKKGYQNDWDGTFDGKQVPEGTYYYVIAGCPDKEPLSGHILVAY
jgi:gliding motility-associated-like protein